MLVIGVDPGPTKSALCGWDGKRPFFPNYSENDDICGDITRIHIDKTDAILAVEKPVCQRYSGSEVSETAIQAGVFKGIWGPKDVHLITRSKIRWHIGKIRKTTDSVVRSRLIDRIHPDYNLHHNPGVLIGIVKDTWQALAVAVTCYDLIEGGEI